MNDELNAAFIVLMGCSFHEDSPAASWFRANKDRIAGVYTLTTSGRYSQIERPEYAAVISDIRGLDSPDVEQCLTLLGDQTTKLVTNWELANIAIKHDRSTERLEAGAWRLRYPKYQHPSQLPARPKILQPGDEFHLIDLLDGTANLPEPVPEIEAFIPCGSQWASVPNISMAGNFYTIKERKYVYRIAPPKLKPLPSEVSALLDEVPEFKTRLIELGYDLG